MVTNRQTAYYITVLLCISVQSSLQPAYAAHPYNGVELLSKAKEAASDSVRYYCTVLDKNNLTPLPKADVAFSDGKIVHTDGQGRFVLPASYSYVIVAKDGFIRRQVSRQELSDTLQLEPVGHMLPAVDVNGYYRKNLPKMHLSLSTTDMKLIEHGQELKNNGQSIGLPVGALVQGIVKSFKKKSKKKSIKEILDNY